MRDKLTSAITAQGTFRVKIQSFIVAVAIAGFATSAFAQAPSYVDVPCSDVSATFRDVCFEQHKTAGIGPEEHVPRPGESSHSIPSSRGNVEVKYDRFKWKTDLTSTLQQPTPHGGNDVNSFYTWSIHLNAAVKEGSLAEPPTLMFLFARNRWEYLNCHDLNFLVDGKPYELASTFKSTMERGAAVEVLFVPLTRQQLTQLGAAKKVEYRICRDEYTLDSTALQDIKDFGPVLDEELKGEVPASDEKKGG